jgi:hypothetical protein
MDRIRALSDGTVELDFATRAGQVYLIRTSSDLINWTTHGPLQDPAVRNRNSTGRQVHAIRNYYRPDNV